MEYGKLNVCQDSVSDTQSESLRGGPTSPNRKNSRVCRSEVTVYAHGVGVKCLLLDSEFLHFTEQTPVCHSGGKGRGGVLSLGGRC